MVDLLLELDERWNDPTFFQRVLNRVPTVPDAIEIVNDDGTLIGPQARLEVNLEIRIFIAVKSIEWKQSVETTFSRVVYGAMRENLHSWLTGGMIRGE